MNKWARFKFTPNKPLYDGKAVTSSEEHIQLALEAAEEGMVLLKNQKDATGKAILPLKRGTKVALFGKGSFDYVRGGGGSGEVYCKYTRNLYDGLKQVDGIEIFEPLSKYYKDYVEARYAEKQAAGMIPEAPVEKELFDAAAKYADTAIFVVSRFSGEGWDRSEVKAGTEDNPWESETSMPDLIAKVFPKGDFYLSDEEEAVFKEMKARFQKVIVVLNVGGIMDTSWIKQDDQVAAALYMCVPGMEGGLAAANLLCGKANPSGKLVDTFTTKLSDYPSAANFHESPDYVDYNEDIYVGYRYFETLPGAQEKVVYPFGYGLSYTDFAIEDAKAVILGDEITVTAKVTNIGKVEGKETVQLYYGAPMGKLFKPAKQLSGFEKTRKLQAGESQLITIKMDAKKMASYDDLGKVAQSAYVLEAGEYVFYVGNSVENTVKLSETYVVTEDRITQQLSKKCAPTALFKRLLGDGTYEELPMGESNDPNSCVFQKMTGKEEEAIVPARRGRDRFFILNFCKEGAFPLMDVVEGKHTLDEFIAQLSVEDMVHLLGGQPNTGVANTWGIGNLEEYGVPNVMTADGPAGVRISPECGISTTCFPCATLLASTWNTDVVEKIGVAAGEELKENNLGCWLAPAVNIHRNPMCGRNFEYYSEDPFVAGSIGSAMVKGVQSNHVAATVKHFAANNKETNRKQCDSRVSERALREIYLKAFEMIVEQAKPMAIMTAYNIVNGHRASENGDMVTGILRGEWGFDGVVMSDWWTRGEHYKEIVAGNDVKMACGFPERVMKAYEMGAVTKEEITTSARRVLEFIMKLD